MRRSHFVIAFWRVWLSFDWLNFLVSAVDHSSLIGQLVFICSGLSSLIGQMLFVSCGLSSLIGQMCVHQLCTQVHSDWSNDVHQPRNIHRDWSNACLLVVDNPFWLAKCCLSAVDLLLWLVKSLSISCVSFTLMSQISICLDADCPLWLLIWLYN